uniref:FAM3 metabolism regulating signaling molecule B n=1 Tax=Taeniopygia guttata TaxID=59729 RepID=H0Z4B5_TAEGU
GDIKILGKGFSPRERWSGTEQLPREVGSTELDRAQEGFGQCSQAQGGIVGVSCAGPGVGVGDKLRIFCDSVTFSLSSAVLHVLLRLHPDCPSSWLLSATSSAWHFALRLFGLVLASVAAWYLGYFVAAYVPQNTVSIAALQEIGKKPVLRAPAPKRQKCDLWSPCPPENFAYRILSGGGKQRRPTICFEDEELINAGNHVAGSGINIAIVNYKTGKFMSTNFFEMWAGDHSREMMDFIRKAPEGTLLLMATHDDGSTRLNEDTKKLVEELGSKEIKNIKFRSSWVFIAAKGFKLPDNIQKEKVRFVSFSLYICLYIKT